MARDHPRSRASCMYFCQSSVLCIIINSYKSPSTSQFTRAWTVITCVSGSTRNPRCSHLYIEPKLLSRGLSMTLDVHLKAERSTPFGPYKMLQLPKKHLKLHLTRHICTSLNTYQVIIFTSLHYSIIRTN